MSYQMKNKSKISLKIGKNYRKKTKKPTANNNSNNIVNNVFDNMNSAFGDVDDDEVRQLILKAKQQARLDQKFGNATTTNSNDKKKMEEDEELWIDEAVNHAIWARGIQKPPRKIRLVVTREEGFPIEVKLVEE